MFRAETLQSVGLYDESLRYAEDYDLFLRLSRITQLANLPEVLLDYRLSPNGISLSRVASQRRMRLRLQLRHFQPQLWQAWVGIGKSLLRLAIPTCAVETVKKLRNGFRR